jgi:fucose 4-O-acetylase-like acetyltransferase
MPIFVFISGYLFYTQYVDCNTTISRISLIKKKATRLLLPYLVFAPLVIISQYHLQPWHPSQPLQPIGHLWFLLMLFGIFAIYTPLISILRKQHLRFWIFFGMLSTSLAVNYCQAHYSTFPLVQLWNNITHSPLGENPLAINDIVWCVPFFALGGLFVRFKHTTLKLISYSIISTAIAIYLELLSNHSWGNGHFTTYRLCNICSGLAIVIALFLIVRFICGTRIGSIVAHCPIIQSIDRYSFSIYLWQSIMINFLISFTPIIHIARTKPILFGTTTFVFVLLFSYGLSIILSKMKLYRKLIGLK